MHAGSISGDDRRGQLRGLLTKPHFALEFAILLLLALTYCAIRYADDILYKELVLGPGGNVRFIAQRYDDRQEGTGHSTMTVDPKDPMRSTCILRPGFFPNPFCGYEMVLADASGAKGIDLSNYRSLAIDLTYKGPGNSIRIFIKNFDPRYSKPYVYRTAKFHTTEVFFHGQRLQREIPLIQFPVAEWWVVREQEDPQATRPEMNNVVTIDLDTGTRAPLGRHDIILHKITLKGTIIPLADWYLMIITAWLVLIALFLAVRIAGHRRRKAREQALQRAETDRLQRQMEASQRANNAKSAFLSNMSHELRTPLNAILGYAQLIERGDSNPRFVSAARTIRDSGTHLLTLINDILDLSKIEAGKMELNPTNFDIYACLRAVEDMIRIRAEEKDLDFRCTVAPNLPHFVIGDQTRLRQVLINLLGNAVKFTQKGLVTLTVSTLTTPGDGVRVRFEVEDSGEGLTAEELERVFIPFEQAGSAQKKAAGTGLGLGISSQMVALMGGKLRARSEKGAGSCFWFELHFAAALSQAPIRVADVTGYVGPHRTILIVDDIEANRLLLGHELQEVGFETIEATNGIQAIALAETVRPDLILMDLKMPVMNGFEAIRELRRRDGFADVPVAAITASATTEFETEALEAGANGFLCKPIDRGQLLAIIGKLLNLDWTTKDDRPTTTSPAECDYVLPSAERMELLLHLARAGNMAGIRKAAADIAEQEPPSRPFAERLQALAGAYRTPDVLALIERHCSPRAAA